MERPMIINTSGAIVTRLPVREDPNTRGVSAADELLPIVPYVEEVTLPVVSYDASAYLRGVPERMAVSSSVSGAALTFFCDGAAGDDSSGDGSGDRPWRTLRHAASALADMECPIFATGCDYVQLKVGSVADSFGSAEVWEPFANDEHRLRLIVTGVGRERVDLGGAQYHAGYFRKVRGILGLRGVQYGRGGSDTVASDCTVVTCNYGPWLWNSVAPSVAVDCDIVGGGGSLSLLYSDILYNCSCDFPGADTRMVATMCVYGGRFVWSGCSQGGLVGVECAEAYGVTVRCLLECRDNWSDFMGLAIDDYAGNCDVAVTVSANGECDSGCRYYCFGILGTGEVQSSTIRVSALVDVAETGSGYDFRAWVTGMPDASAVRDCRIELDARLDVRVSGGGGRWADAVVSAYPSSACTVENCSVTANAAAHVEPSADYGRGRYIDERDVVIVAPETHISSRWSSVGSSQGGAGVESGGVLVIYSSGEQVYSSGWRAL